MLKNSLGNWSFVIRHLSFVICRGGFVRDLWINTKILVSPSYLQLQIFSNTLNQRKIRIYYQIQSDLGRSVTCEVDGKPEIVWQYLFGSQLSEAYRIYEEFGIGEYRPFCYDYETDEEDEIQPRYKYLPTRQGADGDILILNREDIEGLSSCLETLKADESQAARYIWMIEAIRDFILKHPHQEKFIFESEF